MYCQFAPPYGLVRRVVRRHHPVDQVVVALVELVVARRRDLETGLVQRVDRRLVLRDERLERRGTDQVTGRSEHRVRVRRTQLLDRTGQHRGTSRRPPSCRSRSDRGSRWSPGSGSPRSVVDSMIGTGTSVPVVAPTRVSCLRRPVGALAGRTTSTAPCRSSSNPGGAWRCCPASAVPSVVAAQLDRDRGVLRVGALVIDQRRHVERARGHPARTTPEQPAGKATLDAVLRVVDRDDVRAAAEGGHVVDHRPAGRSCRCPACRCRCSAPGSRHHRRRGTSSPSPSTSWPGDRRAVEPHPGDRAPGAGRRTGRRRVAGVGEALGDAQPQERTRAHRPAATAARAPS